jgi:hypothetical protein
MTDVVDHGGDDRDDETAMMASTMVMENGYCMSM